MWHFNSPSINLSAFQKQIKTYRKADASAYNGIFSNANEYFKIWWGNKAFLTVP